MKQYIRTGFVFALFSCFMLAGCSGTGKIKKQDMPDEKSSIVITGEDCEIEYQDIPDEDSKEISGEAKNFVVKTQELYAASGKYLGRGEYDRALSALDEAYSKLLKIDPEERGGEYQQIEDLRFMISKRVMEIYAMRNQGLKTGRSKEIPVVLNQHVDREIRSLTVSERKFFVAALAKSARYRPMIMAKLKEAGLPVELAWLPLIESGYKVNAYSSARALGLWQFIASTGHRYGLKRDQYIDERMDPEKSTDAAISYLKDLHQMFGDWETVLAAYNCGEGRVLRTIRGQNINYLDNFWDLYERLPNETARYVPRFIATLHIVSNLDKYDLALPSTSPVDFETITVARRVSLKDIAMKSNISDCVLRELNPELRHGILPSGSYAMRVPVGYGEKAKASLASISETLPPKARVAEIKRPESSSAFHRVSKGETLGSIAKKYNKSVSELAKANGCRKNSRVAAGKMVKIPGKTTVKTMAVISVQRPEKISGKIISHKVKNRDTLWTIAKSYGSTPEKIRSFNNLKGKTIAAGLVLKIPSQGSADVSVAVQDRKGVRESSAVMKKNLASASKLSVKKAGYAQASYQVKVGDNLFSIARQHNTTVDRILALNRLPRDSKIHPGQKLSVQ